VKSISFNEKLVHTGKADYGVLIDSFENSPAWKLIGMKIRTLDDGKSCLELPVRESLLQRYDNVHGGILAMLADSAMSTALFTKIDQSELISTIELKVNYIRPGVCETLVADGKVVHKGKNIAVCQSVIINGQGKQVIVATGTFMIKKIEKER
jgi:uncharacterized protein (TIGR00369 family)